MLLEPAGASCALDDRPREPIALGRWGVASETGRLTDVLLSAPAYLEMVPCNAVTRDSLAKGLIASPALAARQHRALAAALERAGVRCHFVPPAPGFADLCFTRDAVLMSPWGLVELRPSAPHRQAEPRPGRQRGRGAGHPPSAGGFPTAPSRAATSACCARACC